MSVGAMGWVFRYSPLKGVGFAVHIAIADVVNDEHEHEFYGSIGRLATKARCGRDAARKAVRAMEEHDPPLLERLTHLDDPEQLFKPPITEPISYRFLMPDLPEVFGAAPRSRAATPRSRKGGSPRATGATPPASETRQNQEISQASTQVDALPGIDDPEQPTESSDERAKRTARQITDRDFELKNPKPVQKWIAIQQLAERFLHAGHRAAAIEAAMIAAPTITIASVEVQLSRARPAASPHRGIDSDRGGPDGRIEL